MNIQARQLRVGDLVDLTDDNCATAFYELYPELDGKWAQVVRVQHSYHPNNDVMVSFADAGTLLFPKDHFVTVWKPLGATR